MFARGDALVASVWPANAVILAFILRFSNRGFDRSLAFNIAGVVMIASSLVGGRNPLLAFGLTLANLAEVAVAIWILRGQAFPVRNAKDYARLLLGAVLLGPLASTAVAVCVLALDHSGATLGEEALGWFLSDAVGMGVAAPLLLTLSFRVEEIRDQIPRPRKLVLALLLVSAMTFAVFAQSKFPFLFLVSPCIVAAVFTGGNAGGAIAVAITAVIAGALTAAGHGPATLAGHAVAVRSLILQCFLAAQVLTVPPISTALRRLSEVERRYRRLAERAALAESVVGLGHWHWDVARARLTSSELLPAIYGLEPDEQVNLETAMAHIHPDDVEDRRRRMASVMEGKPIDGVSVFRIVRGSGEIRWVRANVRPELDASGELVGVTGVMMDVTDEIRARAELEVSEERYRRLAETAQDVIIESDLAGGLAYVSPSVERITGYRPEELLGKSTLGLIEPDDVAAVQAAIRSQVVSRGAIKPSTVEFRARTKDGRQIWMEAQPAVVFDPATGRAIGVTDIIRDITVHKALEAKLMAARDAAEQAARVKTDFLSNMSHELRTPLTSIIGFTGLALGRDELQQPARAYVERVRKASDALLALVNDVLDFSKLEAGQVTFQVRPSPVAELSRSVLDLFAPQAGAKGLELVLDFDPSADCSLLIDPDRVRQVMLNLVGNAVKFTESGAVTLGVAYLDGALRCSVRDTGPGIGADALDRLFQRFSQVDGSSTRSHGGTGLGLAISKALVEAMGGKIGVESATGRGSRFWFELPALTAASGFSVSSYAGRDPAAGARVLIVDDHAPNRDLARLILTGAGAEVWEAVDGGEAIEKAMAQPFDVILMDLDLPGVNGAGASAAIRRAAGPNDSTPILAFTSDATNAGPVKFRALGFDGLVAKPIEPPALLAAVAEALQPIRHDTTEVRDAV